MGGICSHPGPTYSPVATSPMELCRIPKRKQYSADDAVFLNTLSKIVQNIRIYHLKEEGLFRIPGSATEVNDLLIHLQENGQKESFTMPKVPGAVMASAMKKMLRQVYPPLIPSTYCDCLLQAHVSHTSSKEDSISLLSYLVSTMESVNRRVLGLVFSLAEDVNAHNAENRMGWGNLSACLSASLVSYEDKHAKSIIAINEVLAIMMEHWTNFIIEEDDLEFSSYPNYFSGISDTSSCSSTSTQSQSSPSKPALTFSSTMGLESPLSPPLQEPDHELNRDIYRYFNSNNNQQANSESVKKERYYKIPPPMEFIQSVDIGNIIWDESSLWGVQTPQNNPRLNPLNNFP